MSSKTPAIAAAIVVCASSLFAQTEREKELIARIDALEKRLAQVESRLGPPSATAPVAISLAAPTDPATPPASPGLDVNLMIDGYYGYNFNRPASHVNLLRAYDVSSNSFSLNQAVVMIERPTDPADGRRFGARLDLQFGQATETLGGNPSNELRPQVYRNIFQAYGTYVAPLGRGLTVDFGKWASALGFENNFTKDQINYSRSYFFNFLPFYHFGVRGTYSFSDSVTASYWLVNGAQQSEDFNGAKSQNVEITLKPSKAVTWTANYYTGNENPNVSPLYNPGPPTPPTQPGLPTAAIRPTPSGRLHIVDTYAAWNATSRLTLAGEADYVIRRFAEHGVPVRVIGGAAYAHYQFGKFGLGARAEYLNDHGGLFSGVTQSLKETTATADYLMGGNFLVRGEWRRDFSNHPFFLTDTNLLKREQNTATLGLIWWFGSHAGGW